MRNVVFSFNLKKNYMDVRDHFLMFLKSNKIDLFDWSNRLSSNWYRWAKSIHRFVWFFFLSIKHLEKYFVVFGWKRKCPPAQSGLFHHHHSHSCFSSYEFFSKFVGIFFYWLHIKGYFAIIHLRINKSQTSKLEKRTFGLVVWFSLRLREVPSLVLGMSLFTFFSF